MLVKRFTVLVLLLTSILADQATSQTRVVKDLLHGSGSSNPQDFFRWGDHVYFSAFTPATGRELFKSDGTSKGTQLVADVVQGYKHSDPKVLGVTGGWLIFSAKTQAMGRELFATKGLSFTPMKEINPGVNGSEPEALLTFKDKIYFRAARSGKGLTAKKNIYICQGTKWERFDTRRYGLIWRDAQFVRFGPNLMIARSGDLYVGDGTAAGAKRVSYRSVHGPLTVIGNRAYFRGWSSQHGYQLWSTNGTSQGTRQFMVFDQTGQGSLHQIVAGGSGIFFIANTVAQGREVFWTDGKKLFTFDIYPGQKSSNPELLVPLGNGKVVFAAEEPLAGKELWIADTTNKAYHVDIAKGTASSSPTVWPASGSRYVYFAARDLPNDRELWRTDGTIAGTVRVADICKPLCSSNPKSPIQLGRELLFVAHSKQAGTELMALDLGGTTQIVGQPSGKDSPTLRVTDPVLNGHVTVDVTLPAKALTMMLFLAKPAKAPYVTIAGCEIYIDPVGFLIGLSFAMNGPRFNQKIGPIPNDKNLVGFGMVMQAALMGLPNLQTTNGVRLHFGM